MADAPRLFDAPAAQRLTDRQERALTYIQETGTQGARPHAIGLAVGATETWAKTTGLEIARALKKKGYVRQKRGHIFIAIDAQDTVMPPGMTDEIPF